MLSRVHSLYPEAAKPGNEKLLRSLQNIEHHLTGKYTPDEKVMQQKVDPVASREESLNRREQAIQNHARQQQQQALRSWHEGTKTSIVESVRSVLTEQIPDAVKSAFKALPNGEQRISNTIKLLDIEVQSAIKSDQNWRTQNANLFKQAEMAPSEERRAAIKAQIIQRYQQKTRQVMTAKAKSIIDAESLVLQKANAATKERMRAGAENKSTPGASQPAPRRIPTDAASSGSWADWIESAI
jgi:predicted DNA binding CopG/RHH family protein